MPVLLEIFVCLSRDLALLDDSIHFTISGDESILSLLKFLCVKRSLLSDQFAKVEDTQVLMACGVKESPNHLSLLFGIVALVYVAVARGGLRRVSIDRAECAV